MAGRSSFFFLFAIPSFFYPFSIFSLTCRSGYIYIFRKTMSYLCILSLFYPPIYIGRLLAPSPLTCARSSDSRTPWVASSSSSRGLPQDDLDHSQANNPKHWPPPPPPPRHHRLLPNFIQVHLILAQHRLKVNILTTKRTVIFLAWWVLLIL